MESSFANSEILRQAKMGELAQSIRPRLLFAEHSHAHVTLGQVLRPAFVAKTVVEPHSVELGKGALAEGKTDRSGSFCAVTQSTLLGAFVSQPKKPRHRTRFPYENYDSHRSKAVPFAHF